MTRALFVGQAPLWPTQSGQAQRMVHLVRGLAAVADVDVFVLVDPGREPADPPPQEPVRRFAGATRPAAPGSLRRWASWLRPGGLPIELAGRDREATREALAAFATGTYDLVYVDGTATVATAGWALPPAPLILDAGDLEDVKARARAHMLMRDAAGSPAAWLPAAGRALLATANGRAWRRLQQRMMAGASRIVAVSEVDVDRLPADPTTVSIVPNGSTDPGDRRRRDHRLGSPPTVLFAGLLTYPPNVDAVGLLTEQVVPRLRARVPDVRVRLVGRADDRIRQRHEPPLVEVTGWIDDLTAELLGADVVIVPIRYGGGTRIKIIEAWAHGVPVVSTTIGAEGLGATDGEDLLLADTPASLAARCADLLEDEGLRDRLAEAGRRRFLALHDWRRIETTVATLATATAGRRSLRT